MENEVEVSETQNTQEVVETIEDVETTTENTEELTPEQIADLKKKAEVSSQNFERAKKAEEDVKKLRKQLEANPSKEGQFSPKDYLALTEAKVSSDDFDEVVRVAKILGKPISETLKDKTMQSILKERVEERRTAAATQTRGGQRSGSGSTPEALLDAARQGKLPESQADIDKLVKARLK